MSRIDAVVATQVGDTSRPRQSAADVQLQGEQAQRSAQADVGGKAVSADELRAIAAQMKQAVEIASGRKLSFRVDQPTGDMVVEVFDAVTNEMVTQIPSKEMLALRHNLGDLVGMLLDRKA
jgi:uncharacterized FlaG/YvyC family protein